MMIKIQARDFREVKDFTRKGYGYYKTEQTDNYMVWAVSKYHNDTGTLERLGWEVWRSKWRKTEDGRRIWSCPSDEDFGRIAWYCTTVESRDKKISDILSSLSAS